MLVYSFGVTHLFGLELCMLMHKAIGHIENYIYTHMGYISNKTRQANTQHDILTKIYKCG